MSQVYIQIFLKIIKFISENEIEVSMATNGRKFSNIEFAKQAQKNGLKNVNISKKAQMNKNT